MTNGKYLLKFIFDGFVSHTECHTADTGLCSRELDVDFRFWSPACNGQSIFQIPLVMGWYHTYTVYYDFEAHKNLPHKQSVLFYGTLIFWDMSYVLLFMRMNLGQRLNDNIPYWKTSWNNSKVFMGLMPNLSIYLFSVSSPNKMTWRSIWLTQCLFQYTKH